MHTKEKPTHKSSFERITAIANVVMALGTIAAVLISYFSLKTSNESLRLTREAFAGSDKKDSTNYDLGQKNLALATRQFDSAQRMNEKSLSIAEKTLGNSIAYSQTYRNSVENENRASLIIDKMGFDCIIGEKITLHGEVKNVGKTPAYHVKTNCSWILEPSSSNHSWVIGMNEQLKRTNSSTTLGSQEYVFVGGSNGGSYSQADDLEVIAGREFLFIICCATYDDVFGKSHFTHYFGRAERGTGKIAAEEFYNDAN